MFKYLSNSWILMLSCLIAIPSAMAQDVVPEQTLTDLSKLDEISRPPTDPHSLSFTPPKPDGAQDITSQTQCQQAGGTWTGARPSFKDDDDVRMGNLNNVRLKGCKLNNKQVGMWSVYPIKGQQKEDNIIGYQWYIDGIRNGWSVQFDEKTHTTVVLDHYKDGKHNGTSFLWTPDGVLEVVANYKDGKLSGKYEEYDTCLPKQIGQYDDNHNPSGVWEIYNPPGKLEFKKNYDKPMPEDQYPSDYKPSKDKPIWTEWYNEKGIKIIEGYTVSNSTEEEGKRIGDFQLYTGNGQPWLVIHYSSEGYIDDKERFDLCNIDFPKDHPIPKYISYNHDNLKVFCRNNKGYIYSTLYYYKSGELWKIEPTSDDDEETGTVYEYYPSGEVLTKYTVKNGVPTTPVNYFDRSGNIIHTSQVVAGTGNFVAYWYNGNKREEGSFLNNVKTSTWKTYFMDGTLETETQYDSFGIRNGSYKEWFSNGVLSIEAKYRNGVRNGTLVGNYTDGRLGFQYQYESGSPKGICYDYSHSGTVSSTTDYRTSGIYQVQYYSDGNKRAEGKGNQGFSDIRRDGNWKFYLKDGTNWLNLNYEDDEIVSPEATQCNDFSGSTFKLDDENREIGCKVCAVNRRNPTNPLTFREGKWTWWNEAGKLEKSGSIRLGHLDGEWNYYYPNEKLMLSGEFQLDKRTGTWNGYYDNGKKKFTGHYADGIESGVWKTYFPSSDAIYSEGKFLNGKKTGPWVYYHENGTVKQKGNYENDLEIGIWTDFYPNGSKQGEGKFENGKREGEWTWYREDGSIWRKANYVNDRETK